MLSEFVLDPLRGRTRLWKVVWLYGLGGNLVYSAIIAPFFPGSTFTTRLCVLGGLILGLYQLAALWQCAYNGRSRFVARFVRASVVISLILVPLFVYLLIVDPIVLSV